MYPGLLIETVDSRFNETDLFSETTGRLLQGDKPGACGRYSTSNTSINFQDITQVSHTVTCSNN